MEFPQSNTGNLLKADCYFKVLADQHEQYNLHNYCMADKTLVLINSRGSDTPIKYFLIQQNWTR